MSVVLALPTHTVGAPPRPIKFTRISHDSKEYAVCNVETLHGVQQFVIDFSSLPLLQAYPSWHVVANSYIATSVTIGGKKKSLYLHNLVMGKLTFDGKGQTTTVDHINRNGFDNRLENLRLISQSEQNINQHKKPRRVELPADCGIDPDTIPRHIWYVKANGSHGDRFAIELKTEDIVWKTTSSKSVSIVEKLEQAKAKLAELYSVYPHLNPENPEILALYSSLTESYSTILAKAKSPETIQHV